MNPTQEVLARILESRAKALQEGRAVIDRADIAKRELTAEDNATIDKAFADVEDLDKRALQCRQAITNEREADEARSRLPGGGDILPGPDRPRDTLSATVRSFARGEISHFNIPFEGRALSKLTAGAGLNTVPIGFYGTLMEHLIASSGIRQTDATVLATQGGGDLLVPTTTSKSTAAITAEAALIAASDPAFGQITLQAHKYAVVLQLSNELLDDNGIDIESFVARQMGEALGNASGVHYVTGTGTGQPKGVVTSSTIGVTGATGTVGAFTADNLIELQFSVLPGYRARGTWFMSDVALAAVRKLKDSSNRYLFEPALVAGTPDRLLGRPVVTDPNVAAPGLSAKSVLFGDFSRYFIRDAKGIQVERSGDFAFTNDLMTYRAILRTDGELTDTSGAVKHFAGGAT